MSPPLVDDAADTAMSLILGLLRCGWRTGAPQWCSAAARCRSVSRQHEVQGSNCACTCRRTSDLCTKATGGLMMPSLSLLRGVRRCSGKHNQRGAGCLTVRNSGRCDLQDVSELEAGATISINVDALGAMPSACHNVN
eukprot:scaffold2580_cov388-Prasinococcus_capsulatus_cf.AAC.26